MTTPPPAFRRAAALSSLALPVLAGIAWLATHGAPARIPLLNGAALTLGLALAMFVPTLRAEKPRRVLAGVLVALLFLPLLTGPAPDGVARWLPLGPVTLHSGGLTIPPLLVLAAGDRWAGITALPLALLAVILQPDHAATLAIALGAGALALARRDRAMAFLALAAIFATLALHSGAALEPQPFVEGVFSTAAAPGPLWPLLLAGALIAGAALVMAIRAPLPARLALLGGVAGFLLASLFGPYPTILIGSGAAPILGVGLALGLIPRKAIA